MTKYETYVIEYSIAGSLWEHVVVADSRAEALRSLYERHVSTDVQVLDIYTL